MARKKQNLEFTVNVDIITKTNKQLESYVDKIKTLKDTVGNRLSATFLDDTIAKIRQGEKQFTNFAKAINNTKLTDKERFAAVEGMVNSYRDLSKMMKSLDKTWMQTAIKNNDTLLDQLDELKRRKKELSSTKGKITKATNATTAAESNLTELNYSGGTTKNDLNAINSQIKNIQKTISSRKEQGLFDNKDLETELDKLTKIKDNINIIIKQRAKLNEYSKEVSNLSATNGRAGLRDAGRAGQRLDTDISDLEMKTDTPENIQKTKEGIEDLQKTSIITAETIEETLVQSFADTKEQAAEAQEATQTLKQVFAQFGIGISAVQIVNYFKELATEAFEFYNALDKALNEIYVVSNLSSKAVGELKGQFISMAQDTGMAIDDVTRSAVLFYQQGLNTDEVMEMTEVTSQFAKVAGIDAADAADKLTAAVNGYCLSATDAASVADKFNQVAAASAADINELSTAFSKAAAQANQAGVSMDNYLAYIATMEEATREAPENIGTSLKTIFSRMQQVKDSGATEEGDTDVNAVETALKSVGIQLRDTEGQLRDLEDVFDELGPKWQSLDRNTQAYLGTIIAGTRQQSRFITLMQNWDRVLELSEESANSAGQQALMHAKSMESIESKIQQLSVAWQEFISNLTQSESIKGIITLFTSLLNKINSGNKPLLLMTTTIALLSKNLTKFDKALKKGIGNVVKFVKGFKSFNKEGRNGFKTYLKTTKALLTYDKSIKKHTKSINALEKENQKIENSQKEIQQNLQITGKTEEDVANQMDKLSKTGNEQAQNWVNLNSKIKDNKKEIDSHKDSIQNDEKSMAKLKPQLDDNAESFNNVTNSLMGASAGFAALSAMTKGGASNLAAIASAMTAMTSVILTSIKAIDAAEWSSVILAIVKAGPAVIMGAITIVKSLIDMFGNQDKKIEESISNMTDSLEEYSNAANKVKGAKSLKEQYEELSNKIYLTTTEQEKLNEVAQSLADSLDIEAVEDQYGNLSVSMMDVDDKIKALEEDAKKARESMIETEQEEIEKYDHNGNVGKFYDEYIKSNKAEIRSSMSSIETGIDTKELKTSASNVEDIMNHLKNNVIENSAEMADAFGGAGIKWSLTEDIESMMSAFNNADIDSTQWNNLYQTFDTLQDKIDTMSYDQALEVVKGAISNWGEAAGLTTEQLKLMQDTIMDTLYGSSNLNKTISGYQDIIDKNNGTSYKDQKASYEKQLADLEKESTTFWNPFKQDDAEREYESVEKKLKLLEEEEEAYNNIKFIDEQIQQGLVYGEDIYGNRVNLEEKRKKLQEEYNIASQEELANAEKMIPILSQMNDSAGEMFNKIGMFDADAQGLLEELNNSGKLTDILNDYKSGDTKEGAKALTDALVDIINNTDDQALKKAAEDKLENVFNSIQISGTMTWDNLSDELDSITASMSKMNKVVDEFNENGSISLETFSDLCDVLDGLDLSTIFDTGMMDQYLGALENLELGFDSTTGAITANADSIQSLQDIQQIATQAKLAETAQSLEADKASLQSQIYAVEAEIAANQSLIEWLKTQGDAELSLDTIKQQGQSAYSQTMAQAVTLTGQQYQSMTDASSSWAEAAITNAAKVGDAIKQAITGQLGSGNLNSYLNQLVSDMNWGDTGSGAQLDLLQNSEGLVNAKAAIAALEEYNVKGANTISALQAKMKGITEMQSLLTKMSTSDLSRLGVGKEEADEVEKYIGQLEEIYNILRKIEGVQNRLDNLQDYMDITTGENYANYLKERISLTQSLTKNYEDLLKAQKNIEATEQKQIKGSVVGNVFDFDQYGNIIIDYKKYVDLQDEEKELADDLYEEYKEIHETTQDYYDDLISNIQAAIDAQQELIDTYVDLEHDLADAVKDIYQNMLDNKLEAIDTEIEALDRLQEAYQEANEAADNSKEISNLQTSLKRSMMDTSGASNTKVLDYQDQISNKLNEMGQDAYEKKMEDIKQALEDQKEALQEDFDEFFEDMEALYNMIETKILPYENRVLDVMMTTEDYKQATEAERTQMLEQWSTDYHAAMTALENGGTIMDVVDSVSNLKDSVATIDNYLKDDQFAQDIGTGVSRALAEWLNKDENGNGSSSNTNGSNNVVASGGTQNNTVVTTPDIDKVELGNTSDTSSIDTISEKATVIKTWWEEFKSDIGDFLTVTLPQWWNENIAPKLSLSYWVNKGAELLGSIDGFLLGIRDGVIKLWDEHIAKFFTKEFWVEEWNKVSSAVHDFFTVTIPEKWESFKLWCSENIGPLLTVEYWKNKLNNIKTSITEWGRGVKQWWNDTVVTWWKDNMAKFFTIEYWKNKLIAVKDGLVEGITNALNGMIDKFNDFGKKVSGWVHGITDFVADKFNAIKDWWADLTGDAKKSYNKSKTDTYNDTIEKIAFANGGMADFTGPAWLDGTKSAPEAVLNAAQTKSFMTLANNLDKLDATGNGLGYSNIQIDNIKFEVESMSSVEDGEKAFDAFVNKFKEIGSQSGLSFTNAKI